jgi:hypothetical protein
MSVVYRVSTSNTTAAGAHDGSSGLFFQRSPDDEIFQGVDLHLYDRCITWIPIAARGWTFQEQYLAPRISVNSPIL